MRKNIFILLLISGIVTAQTFAQNGPLRGSGKLHTKTFDFQDFDKLSLEDLDGKVEIEIGKPFSIKVEIDENLAPLLDVQKEGSEGVLRVALKGNRNNRLYVEDTRIRVKITMPEVSVIKHRGNDDLHVSGIVGRYFRLEQEGNGGATLQGIIDELDIKKNGNGNVKAKNLFAKTAKVKSYGNGNVLINSQISLTAKGAGNGDVLQFGTGKIDSMSGIMGNGSVKAM